MNQIDKEKKLSVPKGGVPEGMLPFDLKKALNGAKVLTRSGEEVQELTLFNNVIKGGFPLVGVCKGTVEMWDENGWRFGWRVSDYDLFLKAEKKTLYMNVMSYESEGLIETQTRSYRSKYDAESDISPIFQIGYKLLAVAVPFEYTEGEGL